MLPQASLSFVRHSVITKQQQQQCMWNVKAKVTPLITGDWNHFKITRTVPEQHTGKAQNQGTKKKQPYWALHTYCRNY
jgi:hypothetical protein